MTQQRTGGGIDYLLTRKKVKNVNLRVGADGVLRVSAPLRCPLREVDELVAARAEWVRAAQSRALQRAAAEQSRPVLSAGECRAVFAQADAAVWPLFSAALGGRRPAIRLREMKSCWGVCHVQKYEIVLNTRLAGFPMPAVEYVLAHEYAHFFHPDHQAGFWALMSRVMPDWKTRRALLK